MEDLIVAAGDTSSNVDAGYNDAEIAAAANGVDGASQRGSESSEQHEQSSRSSVPDNEHDMMPEESLNAVPPNVAQGSELGLGQMEDPLEGPETRASGQDSEDSGLEDSMILSSLPRTLRSIEVVLRPPPDPESYERIRPSRTVLRVLEEVLEDSESDDEGLYTIEFEDGRISNLRIYTSSPTHLSYFHFHSTSFT
ncbi:hypothetical protein F5Y07DRAFT_210397 [Xylaria sp. FL0933]|nr:hypothetical protein F5Y07DRAFT_210397 [Xylaria sp. FL0933]